MLVFGQIEQNTPNLHLGIPQDTQPKNHQEKLRERWVGGHGVVGHDTLGSLSNNDGDGYGNVT